MKCLLLGHSYLDMKTESGELVQGTHIYIAHNQPTVNGQACRKIFVNDKVKSEILGIDVSKFVGKQIEIETDFNGKAVAITSV